MATRPVYSVSLFADFIPVGSSAIFIGDDINTYVIRDILLKNLGDAVSYPYQVEPVSIIDEVGVGIVEVPSTESRTRRSYHWQGRYVVTPSGVITAVTADENWVAKLSGYRLSA